MQVAQRVMLQQLFNLINWAIQFNYFSASTSVSPVNSESIVPGTSLATTTSKPVEIQPTTTAAAESIEPEDRPLPDSGPSNKKPKLTTRCWTCNKKLGLLGFECRCGGFYCGLHRYSDKHNCTFDYKQLGAEEIRKNNPVIVSEKVKKI